MSDTNISYYVSKTDHAIIWRIARRAVSHRIIERAKVMDYMLDLMALHANGCPLNLDDLEYAATHLFVHDLRGITSNIDRLTGQLKNDFKPIHARRKKQALTNYSDEALKQAA